MSRTSIDLTKKKPRDASGASSSNRFSYQVNWAFLKMIELHKAGKEYLVVLDFHDDVVISDSETAPAIVDFYQVKTSKVREWTENRLTARKTKTSLSILGKIYDHRMNFPSNTGILAFVSHKYCGLEMPEELKGQSSVLFGELSSACKRRLLDRIREEHSLSADPACDKAISFIIAPLRIESHIKDLKAELLEYCEELVPDGSYNVTRLYQVIADAMKRQNDNEDTPRNMAELVAKKAISRSKVQRVIDSMMPSDRFSAIWQQIPRDEFGSSIKMGSRRRLHEAFTRYAAHKQNGSNKAAKRVEKSIREALSTTNLDSVDTLTDLFDAIIPNLKKLPSSADPDYLKGAIILEWYDNGNEQLPSADSKSEGEAA